MGQRLNLEILNNGTLLANAYYHWSGYTSSSLRLSKIVLDNIDIIENTDSVITAVKLLECTGADMNPEEKEYCDKIYPDIVFNDDICRNKGLISISERGMDRTRLYEEARVTIDIEHKRIYFGAIGICEKSYYQKYYDDYDELIEIDINLDDFTSFDDFMTFDDFYKLKQTIDDLVTKRVYMCKYRDIVYSFIE